MAFCMVTVGARADSAVSVPVVACSFHTMVGPQAVSVPETVTAVVNDAWRARIAFYSIGENTGVYGPRNWYCHAHSGSNGFVMYVTPDEADPFPDANQQGRVELALLDGAGYGGHVLEVLDRGAPLFSNLRALARQPSTYPSGLPHLTDQQMEPIPNEQVLHESATRATFCDPPGVQGTGAGSGGRYPSCGAAVEHAERIARDQRAPDLHIFSVTMPQSDRAFMDVLVRLNGSP